MEKPNFKPAIEMGLYLLLISVLYLVLAYAVDPGLFTNMWGGIILFLANMVLIAMAPVRVRKLNGGFITFQHAFTAVILAFLVSVIPYNLVNYVLFNWIDPEMAVTVKEKSVEMAISWMEKMSVPQDAMDQSIEEMMQVDQFSLSGILNGLWKSFIFFAIYGLIVSAIVKRKPEYEEIAE